jgi:hypothetical protein
VAIGRQGYFGLKGQNVSAFANQGYKALGDNVEHLAKLRHQVGAIYIYSGLGETE